MNKVIHKWENNKKTKKIYIYIYIYIYNSCTDKSYLKSEELRKAKKIPEKNKNSGRFSGKKWKGKEKNEEADNQWEKVD